MNKTILVLVLIAVAVIAWACKPNAKNSAYKTVGVDEFERLIATGGDSVVVLDVRTPSEYAEGHLSDAVLIDVKSDSFMAEARRQLPRDKTIAVYCRSGRRSAHAADMLSAEGYQLVNLDGGITAWTRAGKATVK